MSTIPAGTKAIIYSRVSSREQAEQGYSIESQLKLLREYAREHRLEVVREFVDVESAKSAGRTQFTEMQKFLKQSRSIKTILCEKTDRLYRNFYDYVALDIDQSGLTVILVKENSILNRDSRSHEKLMHGFKVLLSKNYIDNLREETAKGLLEKAEQGEAPQRAPIGYKNNRETHLIEVDREKAPLIRRMFELYATGSHSLQSVSAKMYEEGLRSVGGRKLYTSETAHILNNPIYYGYFTHNKKLYKGIHEPIISKELFDAANAAMKRFFIKPRVTRREFAFRGLLRCGKCGCSYTAELRKGRYIYYHCTGSKGRCSNRYIREEDVDRLLEDAIKAVRIDRKLLDMLTDGLKDSHSQEKAYHDQAIASLQQTYQRLQAKLDKAYGDKLDGVISAEYWERQSGTWRKEQEEARDAVVRHESANKSYFKLGLDLLQLAHEAYDLYRVRTPSEKRRLANFICSNLTIDGENATPIYKEPFSLLAEGSARPNWLRR